VETCTLHLVRVRLLALGHVQNHAPRFSVILGEQRWRRQRPGETLPDQSGQDSRLTGWSGFQLLQEQITFGVAECACLYTSDHRLDIVDPRGLIRRVVAHSVPCLD